MANIKFSESEKNALVQFNQLELIKAIKTVEQIKERIRTLTGKLKAGRPKGGVNKVQRRGIVKPKRIRRTKAQIAAAAKQTTLRSHHKKGTVGVTKNQFIKWRTFVPQILKQKGDKMTAREILNIAAKKFNVPFERKTKNSLAQTLRNMKKAGYVTAEAVQGSKQNIKQYSLVP